MLFHKLSPETGDNLRYRDRIEIIASMTGTDLFLDKPYLTYRYTSFNSIKTGSLVSFSPDFGYSLISATAVTIVFISHRIFMVVVLMIFFCWVKSAGR